MLRLNELVHRSGMPSVGVPVMAIWKVRMGVKHRLVPMWVTVFCPRCYGKVVLVLVMFIMVFMIVQKFTVNVFVFMTLRQM